MGCSLLSCGAHSAAGKLAAKMGLDPQTVVKLMAGDPSAIDELAKHWGMDKQVMRILLAIADGNWTNVESLVVDVAVTYASKAGVPVRATPTLTAAVL